MQEEGGSGCPPPPSFRKDELSFGYLEGAALKTVSGLKLYNENYDKAWKLLNMSEKQ